LAASLLPIIIISLGFWGARIFGKLEGGAKTGHKKSSPNTLLPIVEISLEAPTPLSPLNFLQSKPRTSYIPALVDLT